MLFCMFVYLNSCSPNVIELLPILKEKTPQLLLKTSPLLDISLASISNILYVL